MIDYRTKPLPECTSCAAPMRRRRWALNRGRCSRCLAGVEALEAAHRSARLAALRPGVTAADARIERLAAKRAARSTDGGQ